MNKKFTFAEDMPVPSFDEMLKQMKEEVDAFIKTLSEEDIKAGIKEMLERPTRRRPFRTFDDPAYVRTTTEAQRIGHEKFDAIQRERRKAASELKRKRDKLILERHKRILGGIE